MFGLQVNQKIVAASGELSPVRDAVARVREVQFNLQVKLPVAHNRNPDADLTTRQDSLFPMFYHQTRVELLALHGRAVGFESERVRAGRKRAQIVGVLLERNRLCGDAGPTVNLGVGGESVAGPGYLSPVNAPPAVRKRQPHFGVGYTIRGPDVNLRLKSCGGRFPRFPLGGSVVRGEEEERQAQE